MAFHFFTENNIKKQTLSQVFGPVLQGDSSIESDKQKYRLTNLFSKDSSYPIAYAICNGLVCVQNDDSVSESLNIILYPIEQRTFNSVPIKYFIYKGIKKSSLVNNSGFVVSANTNKLAEKAHKSDSSTNISTDILGLDRTSSEVGNDDPIEKAFFKDSLKTLIKVEPGDTLGTFDEEFGLDIICDSAFFSPNMALARTKTNYCEIIGTSTNQDDKFKESYKKHEVLYFMDAAAFYGSFLDQKATISVGQNDYNNNYEKYTLINNVFLYPNRLYIDIRTEHHTSYNFYKNYSDNFKIKIGVGEEEVLNYYSSQIPDNTINWPIHIIDLASTENLISIRLNIGQTNENPEPMVHLKQGFWAQKSKLDQNTPTLIQIGNDGTFTSQINLWIPKEGTNRVSNYVRIDYIKGTNSSLNRASSETVLRSYNYAEHVFPLACIKKIFEIIPSTHEFTYVFPDDIYIDDYTETNDYYIGRIGLSRALGDVPTDVLFIYKEKIINNESKLQPIPLTNTYNCYRNPIITSSASESLISKLIRSFNQGFGSNVLLQRTNKFELPNSEEYVDLVDFFEKNQRKSEIGIYDKGVVHPKNFAIFALESFRPNALSITDIISKYDADTTMLKDLPIFINFEYDGLLENNDGFEANKWLLKFAGFKGIANNGIEVVKVEIKSNGESGYLLNLRQTSRNVKFPEITITGSRPFSLIPSDNINSIKCKIYLGKSSTITNDELDIAKIEIEQNIRYVWNRQSNPHMNLYKGKSLVAKDDFEVVVLYGELPDELLDDEVLIMVEKSSLRDLILPNRKVGRFIYPLKQNTPSHEFGHLLGLADRYHEIIKRGAPRPGIADSWSSGSSADGVPFKIESRSKSHYTVPSFIPEAIDTDYAKNSGWERNLMSAAKDGAAITTMQMEIILTESVESKIFNFNGKDYQKSDIIFFTNSKAFGTFSFIGVAKGSFLLNEKEFSSNLFISDIGYKSLEPTNDLEKRVTGLQSGILHFFSAYENADGTNSIGDIMDSNHINAVINGTTSEFNNIGVWDYENSNSNSKVGFWEHTDISVRTYNRKYIIAILRAEE